MAQLFRIKSMQSAYLLLLALKSLADLIRFQRSPPTASNFVNICIRSTLEAVRVNAVVRPITAPSHPNEPLIPHRLIKVKRHRLRI